MLRPKLRSLAPSALGLKLSAWDLENLNSSFSDITLTRKLCLSVDTRNDRALVTCDQS